MSTVGGNGRAVYRRVFLVGAVGAVLGLTACSSTPPLDEEEVRAAVSRVEGVTSVEVRMRKGGGVSGWSLEGRIGLPGDGAQARAAFEECLRAISTVQVRDDVNFSIRVVGDTSGRSIGPGDVGVPTNWRQLKEHFT